MSPYETSPIVDALQYFILGMLACLAVVLLIGVVLFVFHLRHRKDERTTFLSAQPPLLRADEPVSTTSKESTLGYLKATCFCPKAHLTYLLVEGELEARIRAEITHHLSSCDDCLTYAAELQRGKKSHSKAIL